jgi:tellurite methyltransferase
MAKLFVMRVSTGKYSNIFIIFFLSFSFLAQANQSRLELLTGKRRNGKAKSFWDGKYSRTGKYIFGKEPAKFLTKNQHYIPQNAKILDVGMGEGRNAVYLARKGFNVSGVDISSVAIRKAKLLASEHGVAINTYNTSMSSFDTTPETYDVIICFYFVDRKINEKLVKLLKPGGLLIYESHTENQKKIKGNESVDARYLLKEGELLSMFPNMKVLKYEEPMHTQEYRASAILRKLQ